MIDDGQVILLVCVIAQKFFMKNLMYLIIITRLLPLLRNLSISFQPVDLSVENTGRDDTSLN